MRRFSAVAVLAAVFAIVVPAASARVLLVGKYKGITGQYGSIQAAVNAARPGDWILIGPGDYKTSSSYHPKGDADAPAGILITKPRLHLRGMNRNTVIVDGTKPGSSACSTAKAAQNFGPKDRKGSLGLNGIMIWKADNVWVQNVTVCNFLGGAGGDGDTGNEIWWNGGADSGKVGGWGYYGSYMTATSRFFENEKTAAEYGIFSSNWSGGTWDQSYASNFNDSGYYIGACQQICDQTIDHARGEYNALGYSGSNSGGWMLIENSRFDNNEDGFDTNSQNGDEPSPQNGACPAGVKPPVAGADSCWVLIHNLFDHNNNPNAPAAGSAAAGPVGTGMTLTGGRNDTVMDNTFEDNGAWGTVFSPYTDSGAPCTGGTLDWLGPGSCLFDESSDALIDNTYAHDGYFGNPTNGDFAMTNFNTGPTDCFSGNVEQGGGPVTSFPSDAEQMYPVCNGQDVQPTGFSQFTNELLCDAQVSLSSGSPPPCTATDHYPRLSKVVMHKLPKDLATMPNPCAGVPANPWCRAKK
ncbi:MAG TPA: hypothetical protein VIH85_02135 [Solirubrobacteraceae bacterium]